MAWYDRFGKYRRPEDLRWIVFALAALAGLLILLLSGGIADPQALSTIHCATVTEAGTPHCRCEALAASITSGGTIPIWPKGVGGGGVRFTSGRAANA